MLEQFTLLGDPHLGRRFKVGVPLHRAGDREKMVWDQFHKSLHGCTTPFHVNMGDIFDKFVVPPEIVLAAANSYKAAALKNPKTTFVVLRGNHDVSRDISRGSSFDLFRELMDYQENIWVVDRPMELQGYGFVPYDAFTPTAELVSQLPDGLKAVFGHWDIQDWGGDNVIPTQILAQKGIKLAVSGHDHLARKEKRHGVEIIVTGSMQPYSHAEDPEGRLYITTTLDRLPTDTTNLNIRLVLGEGEVQPDDLDCLSLIIQREQSTEEVEQLNIDTLDVPLALAQALDGLSIKDTLLERFHDHSPVS